MSTAKILISVLFIYVFIGNIAFVSTTLCRMKNISAMNNADQNAVHQTMIFDEHATNDDYKPGIHANNHDRNAVGPFIVDLTTYSLPIPCSCFSLLRITIVMPHSATFSRTRTGVRATSLTIV